MVGANVLNVVLNWLLIGGRLGLPALGAEGAALATTLARARDGGGAARLDAAPARVRAAGAAPLAALGSGRLARPAPRCAGSASPAAPPTSSRPSPSPRSPRPRACSAPTRARRLHHPAQHRGDGLHDRARPLGRRPRCGSARPPAPATAAEARFAGLAGARRGDGRSSALLGLVLLAVAPAVVGFYSADPALIARAAPIIAILAVSMVFDAGQVVLGQSTRALGDSWGTTLLLLRRLLLRDGAARPRARLPHAARRGRALHRHRASAAPPPSALLGARFLQLVGAGLSDGARSRVLQLPRLAAAGARCSASPAPCPTAPGSPSPRGFLRAAVARGARPARAASTATSRLIFPEMPAGERAPHPPRAWPTASAAP